MTRTVVLVAMILVCGSCSQSRSSTVEDRDSIDSTQIAASEAPVGVTAPSTEIVIEPGVVAPVDQPTARDSSTTQREPSTAPPASCEPSPITTIGSSTQLISVVVTSNATTHATLRTWEQSGGCWRVVLGPVDAHVGYSGTSTDKNEGDGATPVGVFGIGAQIFGVGSPLPVHGTFHQVQCGDWWDADSSSPTYNTLVALPCGATPSFAGGSEALWTETFLYQHFVLIQYNTAPVVPGRGSAIFLHVSNGGPTAGCVSVDSQFLDQILTWLDPSARPAIAIGTASQIAYSGPQ